MRLSGYTKAVTEQESLALHNGMEYLMLSCIQETRYSKLIRLLFNVYSNNSRLISTKNNNTQNFSTHIVMRTMQVISLTGTQSHIMINSSVAPSSTGVKKNDILLSSSNAYKGAIYTGVLDQKRIRLFCRSIGYPIVTPSKLHEENQATIKRVFYKIITPQARPIDALITSLNEYYLQKTFVIVETIKNMKLTDLNSKPYGC